MSSLIPFIDVSPSDDRQAAVGWQMLKIIATRMMIGRFRPMAAIRVMHVLACDIMGEIRLHVKKFFMWLIY